MGGVSTEPTPEDEDAEVVVAASPQPPRRVRLLITIAVLVVLADLLSKVAVVANLDPERPVRVLDGAIYLVLVRNAGAAFSVATGMTWVLTIVAAAVVIAIVRMARRLRSVGWAWGLGLVLGGALGNLIDRIFRAPGVLQGHVVDFVSVILPGGYHWPVFNIADSCIVTGGILLVVLAFRGREPDGTRATRKHSDANDDQTSRA
ncbi:MAG: signal peptidase II [Mycobacteriaceae bacterium]